jgi:hypothetical protein
MFLLQRMHLPTITPSSKNPGIPSSPSIRSHIPTLKSLLQHSQAGRSSRNFYLLSPVKVNNRIREPQVAHSPHMMPLKFHSSEPVWCSMVSLSASDLQALQKNRVKL